MYGVNLPGEHAKYPTATMIIIAFLNGKNTFFHGQNHGILC
jgi:hypothetical protein